MSIKDTSKKFLISDQFNFLLILFGVIFRLKSYLANCSFWLDEVWVALHVTSRSLIELCTYSPIFPNVVLPPAGFSIIERILYLMLGNTEYTLRLFPFACGISTLLLFYQILKYAVNKETVPIALGLFVFCESLIRYSSELKQYSSDVFFTLLLVYGYQLVLNKNLNRRSLISLGILSAVSVWFCHPAIFVLAGIWLSLTVMTIRKKRKENLLVVLLSSLLWIQSFVLMYLLFGSFLAHNAYIKNIWSFTFMPDPLWSISNLVWAKNSLLRVFDNPLGFLWPLGALFLFILGIIVLLRKKSHNGLIILIPVILTFIAAILHKYPFYQRTIVFLVPFFLITIAQGCSFLIEKSKKFAGITALVLVVLLFIKPVQTAIANLRQNTCTSESRIVMEYLKEHIGKNDSIAFNGLARPSFWYYGNRFGLFKKLSLKSSEANPDTKEMTVIEFGNRLIQRNGITYFGFHKAYDFCDKDGFYRSTQSSKTSFVYPAKSSATFTDKKRVWIFLESIKKNKKDIIVDFLDRSGKRLDSLKMKNTAVCLYDFSDSEEK